ncbi:MAG: DUF1854 domain-containing protein [Candidatus Brocadiia bacterium]
MAPHWHHHHHHGSPRAATTGPSLPTPSETSSELRYLDPRAVGFRRQEGRFQARVDGQWRDAHVVRLFPLSEEEGWIAVIDEEGREMGILRNAHKLARADLDVLREELRRRYVVPQIRRIVACRRRPHRLLEWTVETDRGELTFRTGHLREQVRDPHPRRLTLVDVEGNRYDIPRIQALDRDSQRRLMAHI